MTLYQTYSDTLRNRQVNIHCHKLKLTQKKVKNGYRLSGYGTIKVDTASGSIYADVIITKEKPYLAWGTYIPSDPHMIDEYFSLEAITITGKKLISDNIRIKTDSIYIGDQSKNIIIALSDIRSPEMATGVEIRKWKRSVRFDFFEKQDIPRNKVNTYESSLGNSGVSWNESIIENEKYYLSIVKYPHYSTAYLATNKLNIEKLYKLTQFYIGFMSGVIVQPFSILYEDEKKTYSKILSIDINQIAQNIPAPSQSNVQNEDGRIMSEEHFSFLNLLIEKQKDNTFDSINSYWERVWHACQSKANSIQGLTITTSIEGLLNDFIIPVLEKEAIDKSFQEEKQKIIDAIKTIENINNDHINNIVQYVNKWGNIHSKKALSILQEKQLLSKSEIKNWSDLRNSLAHPRTQEDSPVRRKKNNDRVLSCLGIFYKLIFNIYQYHGPYTEYYSNGTSKVIFFRPILN